MLAISIFNRSQHSQVNFVDGVIRVGRIPVATDAVGTSQAAGQTLLIEDPMVAQEQLSLTWKANSSKVELRNYGPSIALETGPRIHRGRTVELELPALFCVGDTQVHLFDTEADHPLDFALTNFSEFSEQADSKVVDQRVSPGPQTLAAWLETLSELQRNVAGSQGLLDVAARAVFNPGGLDGGMVLLPSEDGWKIAATHVSHNSSGVGYREDLIKKAVRLRKTIYHDSAQVDAQTGIEDLHAAVVCPVLGVQEDVVAVIYGFRSLHGRNNRRGVRLLEAQFVKVVADSLSAGMVRLKSEADAARSNVLLEQVFSPKIAKQLQANHGFLESKECEVSVLFADLRRFSTISERIGNHDTYELLADVMDKFTNIISDLDGVVIDYYGDGVSAFWNAPIKQAEHAMFACAAGQEILQAMNEINEIWLPKIGEELKVGVGVHTGMARVGNSGSRTRIKYGPRGNTVNLTSRLETATKMIGVPMLISGETAERVRGAFKLQRIIKTTLPGMSLSNDVFRIHPKAEGTYLNGYEQALGYFEAGEFEQALAEVEKLEAQWNGDPVCRFLRAEILQAMNPSGTPNNKVAQFDLGKTDSANSKVVAPMSSKGESSNDSDSDQRHILFGKT